MKLYILKYFTLPKQLHFRGESNISQLSLTHYASIMLHYVMQYFLKICTNQVAVQYRSDERFTVSVKLPFLSQT